MTTGLVRFFFNDGTPYFNVFVRGNGYVIPEILDEFIEKQHTDNVTLNGRLNYTYMATNFLNYVMEHEAFKRERMNNLVYITTDEPEICDIDHWLNVTPDGAKFSNFKIHLKDALNIEVKKGNDNEDSN